MNSTRNSGLGTRPVPAAGVNSGLTDDQGFPAVRARRMLRHMSSPTGTDGQSLANPAQTELEHQLCQIWSEVLGRPVQNVAATFMDLGGGSLQAAKIAARIWGRLGIRVDLATILRFRSVQSLAASIEALPQAASAEEVPLTRAPSREELAMSFFQEWRFRSDQGKSTPLYTITLNYEIRGELQLAALRDAIDELVRRHEPLRTNYEIIASRPVQLIKRVAALELPTLDVRGAPEDRRKTEALRLLTAEAARPVDRRRDAIFQPLLVRFADDGYLLSMRMDRIAVDGASCRLIEEELSRLYAYCLSGLAPPEPPALQQADWASWQRRVLTGPRLDRLVEYWRRKLDGTRPLLELRLPNGFAPPDAPTHRGRSVRRPLGPRLSSELRRRAREADVTLFMYVLAGIKTFAAKLSDQDEATVLCPFANRTRPELEQVVGCFSHGAIYRTELSGDPPFGQVVARVRDVCLEAFEHLELPISEVARHVRPESYLTLYDEFHVFFDVIKDQPMFQLPRLDVRPSVVATDTAHPGLTVLVEEGTDGLALIVQAEADRFAKSVVDWITGEIISLLATAVRDPAERVSRLPPSQEAVRECFGIGRR
jgi:Condensation domain/Phosphopantetheine attachment site